MVSSLKQRSIQNSRKTETIIEKQSNQSQAMSQIKRYQNLGYSDSIQKIHGYPLVCKELSFFLRAGYSKSPKNLQALIYQDVLTALRLVPGLRTRNGISAAHLLYQSAEASLPKQKKNLAVTEFKKSMITLKRCLKSQHEKNVSGSIYLPHDVLLHIFSFLDFQSLVSAGLVSWSWNLAASDNQLWHVQYESLSTDGDSHVKRISLRGDDGTSGNWKETFRTTYRGESMKKLASGRGYCENCKTIVWLKNMKCSSGDCPGNKKIKNVSLSQVLNYVLDGFVTNMNSSESDSDSDEDISRPMSRYWASAFLE